MRVYEWIAITVLGLTCLILGILVGLEAKRVDNLTDRVIENRQQLHENYTHIYAAEQNIWAILSRDQIATDSLWKVPIIGVDSCPSYDLNTPEGRQKYYEQTGERWKE